MYVFKKISYMYSSCSNIDRYCIIILNVFCGLCSNASFLFIVKCKLFFISHFFLSSNNRNSTPMIMFTLFIFFFFQHPPLLFYYLECILRPLHQCFFSLYSKVQAFFHKPFLFVCE